MIQISKRMGAIVLAAAAVIVSGCSSNLDTGDDSSGALTATSGTGSAILLAPQVESGGRYWDTLAFQNDSDFDGVIAIGRSSPDGDAEQIAYIEQKTGAIAFLTARDQTASWDDTRQSLSDAADRLMVMAGDAQESGVALADFQSSVADHACMIRYAALSLAAIGAVVAADMTAGAVPGIIAAVQERGVQQALAAAARVAVQSPRVRALLALKGGQFLVEGWVLFSDRGKQLTAPVRQAVSTVVHAECTPSMAGPDDVMYVMP